MSPKDAAATTAPRAPFASLFSYASPLDIVLIVAGSVNALLAGTGIPLFTEVFGRLVTELASPTVSEIEDSVSTVALYGVGVGAMMLVTSAIFVACFMIAAERQTVQLKVAAFRAILAQDAAFHDSHPAAAVGAQLESNTAAFKMGVNDRLALGLFNMSMCLTGVAVGLYRSWQLTLLMFGVMPFLAAAGWICTAVGTAMERRSQVSFATAAGVAYEALQRVTTVQLVEAESREIARFTAALDRSKGAGIAKGFATVAGLGVAYGVMFLSYAAAFRFGAWLVRHGHNDVGDVMTCFAAMMMANFGLGMALPTLSAVGEARDALGALQVTMNTPFEMHRGVSIHQEAVMDTRRCFHR